MTQALVRAVDDLGVSGPLKVYEHVLPLSAAPPGLYATPDDHITTALDVEPWRERMLAAYTRTAARSATKR